MADGPIVNLAGNWPPPVCGIGCGRPHWTVVREVIEEPPWSVVMAEYEKDPLTKLVESQGGVAGWQARAFLSESALRHRVETGRWRRLHRSVYFTYGSPLSLTQRHWLAVLAATPDLPSWRSAPACLGGISALQVHGLRNLTSTGVHVVVAGSRRAAPPPGVVLHRVRLLDEDRHPALRPPATTVARSVVDAAAWARSDDEARLLIAASFQQRLVTGAEIGAALDRLPTVRRRRLILVTAQDAAGGSHSLGELGLVRICREFRLPLPTRQLRFRDSAGRRRFLDAVFDPWRIAVEVDGAHHDDVQQRWDDMDRENDMVLADLRVLRFPVHVVRERPGYVAARIRAALELAGWRSDSRDRL